MFEGDLRSYHIVREAVEVVEIQLEEMAAQGTLDDYLAECGFTQESDGVASGIELISVEKQSVQVAWCRA